MKKAQISLEFLLVLGFAIMLIFPATLLFMNFVSTSSNEITSIQVQNIGETFAKNSRAMYYYGDGAFIEITINFPAQIDGIEIQQNQLIIESTTNIGKSASYFNLQVEAYNNTFPQEDVSEGIKHFIIRNDNNTINISRIKK